MDSPRSSSMPGPEAIEIQPTSPRYSPHTATSTTQRKIAIPVDLSDESAYAVRWAVQNYLRPGDTVTLVHVRPTSVLYGADWGSTHFVPPVSTAAEDGGESEESRVRKIEDNLESFTAGKLSEVAQPLVEAKIPFKVHVVKDHDMKERLCLEIERLGMSVVIMGSRGFGALRRSKSKERLGSVSDYCVHHCVCPVIVVRYPEERNSGSNPMPEDEPRPGIEDAQATQQHSYKDQVLDASS